MTPFVFRLVVGSAGTAAVGAFLITLLVVRRRKRARRQETILQPTASGKQPRQPGLLQTLVISVVASVISGVLLFFITPLFTPDSRDTAQLSDIPQAIRDDSAVAEPERPLDLDLAAEEPAPEPVKESEAPSTIGPTPLEPIDMENDREPAPVVEVRTPQADVLVVDTTTEWEALLQPPIAFDEVVFGDGRLQIVGASVSVIVQLTGPDPLVPFEPPEPRILLDETSVSSILRPIAPPIETMTMDSRVLIQGAQSVKTLKPAAPSLPCPGLRAARVLIEDARATMLLELNVPELDQQDT